MVVDPSLTAGNQLEESLPPPRFDAGAAASAQTVEPIQSQAEVVHHHSIHRWVRKLRLLSDQLGGQSRALAIVVLIGLITGALGGSILVNATRRGEQTAVTETAVNDSGLDMKRSETQKLDAFAAGLGGAALETSPSRTRNRKGKALSRTPRPRAYRVAVLR